LNGQSGADSSLHTSGSCSGLTLAGGSAGSNSTCSTGNGFAGGSSVCPVYNMFTFSGTQEQYTTPTSNGNGRGGFDWSVDQQSQSFCGHATESGWPSNIQAHDGADGDPGADGTGASGGTGAPFSSRFGSLQGGRWIGSPNRAAAGATGGTAKGGGGGGAG